MDFKPEFTDTLQELPGTESSSLLKALDTPSPVSIRFNPFKISEKPDGDQVPWCRYGFYLEDRPSFTLDPAFHGGAYYVQEASSMFVEHLMREAFSEDGCEGLRILDLCASPGGKTTLLSTLAGLEGVVVANEITRQRTAPLTDNAIKWGLGNIIVTHNAPEAFSEFKDIFDAIVVDAPCSGEGMMRKNDLVRSQWSLANVRLCAARQKRIIADAWAALRPGGVMIYSTCTFNRLENEDNLEWMMQEFDCEGIDIDIDPAWGVVCGEVEHENKRAHTFRFYPDKIRGEGFFACIVRKADGKIRIKMPKPRPITISEADRNSTSALKKWVDQPDYIQFTRIGDNFYGYYAEQYSFIKSICERLNVIHSGVAMGQLFHGKLRPEHSLALFSAISREAAAQTNLTEEQAVAYLRKQELATHCFEQGLNLVCFEGLPIGWAKRIGLRVNNLYPKEIRIMN